MAAPSILIVDDDASICRVLEYTLSEEGYDVRTASSAEEAMKGLTEFRPGIVVTDVRMPGMSGMELLKQIKAASEETIVIVMTAYGSIDTAVEALKLGALDFMMKPVSGEEVKAIVAKAVRIGKLESENRYLRQLTHEKYGIGSMVGNSKAMQKAYQTVARVAPSDATVLITGDSGTGKELVAKAIHFNSPRAGKPFVVVNCPAIPDGLMESELFGHVKGAFTGAVADRPGKIEIADGGTVFLDEVGDIKPDLQGKLLRVLQDGAVSRVGCAGLTNVDVRIVAATNRDLQQMVRDSKFREDLFYRLSVVTIWLPPLRNRKEDIPQLTQHFLRMYCGENGKPLMQIEPEVMNRFVEYDWPGNIRELENAVERLVCLSGSSVITAEDLPEKLVSAQPKGAEQNIRMEIPDDGVNLEGVERMLLEEALRRNDWNQTKAARFLRISRSALIYRMEKFNLRDVSEKA